MNNIATIQRVKNVRNHPNGDVLDLCNVLGWQVVIKRNEFKENDLCVYVVIDSVLPDKPEFEFLRNKSFRIKPIRLRKEESAGICFPLSIIPGLIPPNPILSSPQGHFYSYNKKEDGTYDILDEGVDVTEIIGVTHYEKPIPASLAGQAFGSFPGYMRITDEDNLRSYPSAVPEMFSRPFYITRKDDGSSGTFFIKGGEFGVCSRRIHLKDTEGNGFWNMSRKYDVNAAMLKAFPGKEMAIQGEVCGPGIQANKLGLKEMEFHLFNIWDINQRTYLDYAHLLEFSNTYGIPMVTTIEEGNIFGYSLEDLIKLSNAQKYPTGGPAEGIVIRPKEGFYSTELKKSWSGKVINENYKE